MRFLISLFAIMALFVASECGYLHGGGYGGGYGSGGGSSYETPIVHTGAVVSRVFGPTPHTAALYRPVPIPDHGYERYVIHRPRPALRTYGYGYGYGHYGH